MRIEAPETGKEIVRLVCNTDGRRAAAFSHDGKRLLSLGEHPTGQVWDVATGFGAGVLQGHEDHVRCVAFHPDGRSLASAGGGIKSSGCGT